MNVCYFLNVGRIVTQTGQDVKQNRTPGPRGNATLTARAKPLWVMYSSSNCDILYVFSDSVASAWPALATVFKI